MCVLKSGTAVYRHQGLLASCSFLLAYSLSQDLALRHRYLGFPRTNLPHMGEKEFGEQQGRIHQNEKAKACKASISSHPAIPPLKSNPEKDSRLRKKVQRAVGQQLNILQ
jgi:hypothetical protein